MNILIVTHYYPPEIGAPQARLSEMAKTWANDGHNITVLTCFPNHPTGIIPDTYKNKHYLEETIDGIKVIRTWVYATPNKGFIKKIAGHLSFMFSAVIQGHKATKNQDIIIASSPTFFSIISAYVLSRLYKTPYIFEVRDLWPAIFKELGVLKNKFILDTLERIELFLYRKAKFVVSVTESFTQDIANRGINKKKLFTVTNGVDLDRYYPKKKEQALIDELSLNNKFIVLYIGAHGISQGLSTIIDTAQELKGHASIHFLFIGEGADKENIIAKAKSYNLNNITFLPGQDKEKVTSFYSIMDVGLVPLKDIPLFKTFIPSKMFEMMGMGKPIIASVSGEAETILKKSKGALIAAPENYKEIAEQVLTLFQDKELQSTLSKNGLQYVKENYDRKMLAKKYIDTIKSLSL
ncbi:glycosyltransferase WbuB [Candidatus Marinamargulisbacteria bacterium SCGC AAA071-K20]|nr:glycosyltransferase WbuB [Candidatus Marinamargulisbacteria bacterium SCGC AAA071-K20]